jgi:hemolysin activation/secretion protein
MALLRLCRRRAHVPARPAAEQEDEYSLASVGLGTRASLSKWLSGSLDWGYPLLDGPNTQKQDSRLHFSVQATF